MQVVTIIANTRGTTERAVMNGMTYRQIEHVAGAIVADKMFVARVLLAGIGRGRKDEDADGDDELEDLMLPPATGKLPDWFEPMNPRPGVEKINAGVVDLREQDGAPDLFGMQAAAVRGTVPRDRRSGKLREPKKRERFVKKDEE